MYCKHPTCRNTATETWALLPLCTDHRETIRAETAKFYNRAKPVVEIEARPVYMEIAHLIPWSKVNMKRIPFDGEDDDRITTKKITEKRKRCMHCNALIVLGLLEEHEQTCEGSAT